MKAKIVGVALAAVMACGWASGAQAYTAYGHLTSVDIAYGDAKVGNKVELVFDFREPYQPGAQYSVSAYLKDVRTGDIGIADGAYSNSGFLNRSELSFALIDLFTGFGFDTGDDGGLGARINASSHALPLDPAESFSPVLISGFGGLSGFEYVLDGDGNSLTKEFSVSFSLDVLRNDGSVSPIPLPSSAPLLGVACLVLGAVGLGIQRKKPA